MTSINAFITQCVNQWFSTIMKSLVILLSKTNKTDQGGCTLVRRPDLLFHEAPCSLLLDWWLLWATFVCVHNSVIFLCLKSGLSLWAYSGNRMQQTGGSWPKLEGLMAFRTLSYCIRSPAFHRARGDPDTTWSYRSVSDIWYPSWAWP